MVALEGLHLTRIGGDFSADGHLTFEELFLYLGGDHLHGIFRPDGPKHQIPLAVWTYVVHSFSARSTEGALIGTNVGRGGHCGGGLTLLAMGLHF